MIEPRKKCAANMMLLRLEEIRGEETPIVPVPDLLPPKRHGRIHTDTHKKKYKLVRSVHHETNQNTKERRSSSRQALFTLHLYVH
jgi:hypothetical protein